MVFSYKEILRGTLHVFVFEQSCTANSLQLRAIVYRAVAMDTGLTVNVALQQWD